ncbi:hypothetical protein ACFLZ8_03665 [Planctomycetota bacterium]
MCIVCSLADIFKTLRQDKAQLGDLLLRYSYLTFILLVVCSGNVFASMGVENNSDAVLTVEVTNKTENGTPVADDEIFVQIYQHQQLFSTLEGKVSDEGKTIFQNVPTGEQIIAVPRVKHREMMFTGTAVVLSSTENEFVAQVEVFDVSVDKSKLSVETHHLIIRTSSETETLEITELMQLVNSSDMAISSQERDDQDRAIVLNILLPEGFNNLRSESYFEEHALVLMENGFYDTMAIPPGSYHATFSYTLDITSPTMDIVKKVSLPTSNCMVLVEGGAQLHSLSDVERQVMNDVSMEYLRLSNLAAGEEISFQVTGLTVGKNKWITWIILTVVFGVMIVFAVIRSRPANN